MSKVDPYNPASLSWPSPDHTKLGPFDVKCPFLFLRLGPGILSNTPAWSITAASLHGREPGYLG